MDPAKIGFIRRAFIEERAAKIFRKPACPHPVSPLKITRHIVQLLAITILIANGAHSSVCGFLFSTHSCYQWHYEQIWNL
jgi:hypothetical protein